jgi:hypothetical protein
MARWRHLVPAIAALLLMIGALLPASGLAGAVETLPQTPP